MANEFKVRKSLVVNGSGSVLFDVQGSQGQLFSITDSLSGSLFAVKDISGMPVMEAFSDNTVRMGQFGQKVLFVSQSRVGIGKETPLNSILDISGSATVTGSVSVSGSILQNGAGLAVQDGTILYHSIAWFTPSSTVSTSGTTVTSIGTQFTSAMVGAKLTISGESRIITAYTSTTQVTVASAYSQNYSGVASGSWSVYRKCVQINSDGTLSFTFANGNWSITDYGAISLTDVIRVPKIIGGVTGMGNEPVAFGVQQNVNGLALGSSYVVQWGSGSYIGNFDLGLRRNTTGSLEIYNGVTADGTIANRRDLILRNITGSNATFSGSLLVVGPSVFTGSFDITGSSTFTGPVSILSGSLNVSSASLAVSGSLSINGVNITATGGFQQTFTAATTWIATHNLNTLYPVITVYNDSGQVIIPASITATSANVTTVTFNVAAAGTINILSGQLQQNIVVSNPTAVALSTVLGG